MNTKVTTVTTAATKREPTIHAEMMFGCGALGCKEKTMEDLWFAERDHNLLENLKKKSK